MLIKNLKHKPLLLAGAILVAALAPLTAHEDDAALRAKEFVVMGYEGILFELRSGEGAYLRTLIDLLRIDPDQRSKTVEQIRTLSKTVPNIMDFADQVIKLQGSGRDGALATTPALAPVGPGIYSGEQLERALKHLTRGMKITVYSNGGRQFTGQFEEYVVGRLWTQGMSRSSFLLKEILAIDAPDL